ncbi:hypothetical protein ACVWW6_000664 [Bradyrhizobium sp. USDA 3311]
MVEAANAANPGHIARGSGTLEPGRGSGKLMDKLHPGENTATPYEAAREARPKFVEG